MTKLRNSASVISGAGFYAKNGDGYCKKCGKEVKQQNKKCGKDGKCQNKKCEKDGKCRNKKCENSFCIIYG